MRYIVYHKDTTRFLSLHPTVRTNETSFATEAAAKAARTREHNRRAINRDDFLITDSDNYFANVQKLVTKRSLMTGQEFQQPVNTPLICDPSSETYWSA